MPRSFIDQLLDRVDLVDLIGSRIKLKNAGRNLQACCPFHDEKTPSFTVNKDKQFYHCFGCKAHGDAIGFLMQYENLSFIEAVEELAKMVGIRLPQSTPNIKAESTVDLYAILEQSAKLYAQQLEHNQVALEYLLSRGLTEATIKQFELGYAPNQWDYLVSSLGHEQSTLEALKKVDLIATSEQGRHYDRFRHRILFPIHNRRGRVVGFGGRVLEKDNQPKYLNTSETPIFQKRQELYGLKQCLSHSYKPDFLLVTEGYMDVLALHQAGLPNAVAAMGTALSLAQLRLLFRYSQRVILCFDGDAAGQLAAVKSLKALLPHLQDTWRLSFLMLASGEDPDSLIKKQGIEAFQKCLAKALGVVEFVNQQLAKVGEIGNYDDLPAQIAEAKQWLQLAPNKAWQASLLKGMSHTLKVNAEAISQTVLNSDQRSVPFSEPWEYSLSSKRQNQQSSNRQTKLLKDDEPILVLLLNFPQLVNQLEDAERKVLAQSSQTLQQMVLLLRSDKLNTAALMRHWQNTAQEERLKELLLWPHVLDESQSLAELRYILEKQQLKHNKQHWQKIHAKVVELGLQVLSEEERQIYRLPPK